uniref:Outer membrane protein A n=1 Tax=Rickettsia felis TaxID=42862 RepID=Q645J0_RICFI|nr:outer membrane protein A [Rickettsia felis]
MANISLKLFQKAIQKGLKTALFTTSTAAIMLTGSGVLGAARTVTADGAELAAGTNIGPGAGAFVAGSTLQYTGAFTVTDADVSVRALDLNNFAAGLFSVTGDISLGSVVDTGGANKLAVNIDDGLTLTLTGTGTAAYGANPALLFQGGQAAANNTYTALGNITLGGANAGLTIASDPDVLGPITLAGNIDGGGIITDNTDAAINGTIGNTNPAAQISIGASTLSLGGAVIKATTTKLTNAASVLTLTNANAVLTGAVDNTTGGDDVGVLNLNGALSQVTGNIGNTNSLATISVGAGTATLGGAVIKATTTKLTNAASVLTLTNAVLTGAVDNTTGGDNVGVVNLNGALSQVTGNVGNTNSLATINIGAGVATLDGAVIKATTTKLTDDASVLIFTNPVVVTGAIDNTGNANKGVVIFTGASTVTDNIGNTAVLAEVSVGAGLLQIQGGVVKANAINLTDNASVVTFTGDSTVTGSIGGTELFATVNIGAGITLRAGGSLAANNIDFGAASNLEFNGPAGKNYNLIGTIANGNNATLNINAAGTVIANDVSIGTVAQINIQNNKIFVINAKNADVDILDAQAISFKGAASRLFLANVSLQMIELSLLKIIYPVLLTVVVS